MAFTTPGAPSSEIIAVDTRSRGVLPTERKAMTRALTGETSTIDFLHEDYFPLTYPLLFPHGGICGWHSNLKSTTGHKISLIQWVTQLLLREPRFQKLGPLVNEFLIDVFSCIEDQRLSFHAFNQDKYTTSVHQRLSPRESLVHAVTTRLAPTGSSCHRASRMVLLTKPRN